jgi:hypothetical protein
VAASGSYLVKARVVERSGNAIRGEMTRFRAGR